MLNVANIFMVKKIKKLSSLPKFIASSAALSLVMLSSASLAKTSNAPEDAQWFEIEIILLQQLMDHSQNNESFVNQMAKSKALKSSINLIERYFQKQHSYAFLLNQCASPYDKPELLNEPEVDEFGQAINQYQEDVSADTPSYEYLLNDNVRPKVVDLRSPTDYVNDTISSYEFTEQPNDVYFEQRIDCSPKAVDMFSFSLTDTVAKVPLQITGSEDVYSTIPYLLAKDGLQLDHIVKSLKRSKQFRPLVHMAWRQPVFDRRHAIPVKVFAGDNLKYNSTNTDDSLAENAMLAEFDLNQLNGENQQRIQQHLQSIINKVNGAEISVDTLIENINKPVKPLIAKSSEENALTASSQNSSPLQQWLVDGWFKVHLDHYLFINSEFNFYKQPSENQKLVANVVDEIIPFKQNRRVISGEVHYFDHPFMGMIVQIRRHKRPDPNEELADQ